MKVEIKLLCREHSTEEGAYGMPTKDKFASVLREISGVCEKCGVNTGHLMIVKVESRATPLEE